MNINDVTFDNFLTLSKEDQDSIFNDINLLKELVRKNNISKHRYEHSLSVAELSKELAMCHNVDPNKAYLAGILHDVCKFVDSDTSGYLESVLKKYEPDKLNGITGAYHSWAAYYYLKEKTNFNDEEVLNAIYNHTICMSDDPLSLIVYIADKREPLRNINDNVVDIARKDLKEAKRVLDISVKEYIEGKNGKYFKDCL